MNQLALNASPNDHPCADAEIIAEQELAAFFSAVTELYGREQAELSADEWLEQLASINGLPGSVSEWRRLSIKVSVRLAKRVKAFAPPAMAPGVFASRSR